MRAETETEREGESLHTRAFMSFALLPRSLVTTTFGCDVEEADDAELTEDEARRHVILRNCREDDDDDGARGGGR
mgnify:CR=1 FL=1